MPFLYFFLSFSFSKLVEKMTLEKRKQKKENKLSKKIIFVNIPFGSNHRFIFLRRLSTKIM